MVSSTNQVTNINMRKRLKLDGDGGGVDTVENVEPVILYAPGLLNLSDDMLLMIMSHITHIDLINLSLTCHRLGSVAKDYTLWRKIDFGQPLRLQQLRRCLPFLRSTTVTMVIHGFVNRVSECNIKCVSPTFLQRVTHSCPQLNSLTMNQVYMHCKEIKIIHFPSSLTYLSLEGCEVHGESANNRFFSDINQTLPNLQVLVLTNCTWLASHSLMAMSKCEKLRELHLDGCIRLKRCVAYTSMAAQLGFKALETLDLRNTLLTDSEVSSFSNCPTIKHLFLESPNTKYFKKLCVKDLVVGNPSCCPNQLSTLKRRLVHPEEEEEEEAVSISCGKVSKEKSSSANITEASCGSAADRPSGSGHNTLSGSSGSGEGLVGSTKQDKAVHKAVHKAANDSGPSGSRHVTPFASASSSQGSVGNTQKDQISLDSANRCDYKPSGAGHDTISANVTPFASASSSQGSVGNTQEDQISLDSANRCDYKPSGAGHDTISASTSGEGLIGNTNQNEASLDSVKDIRPSGSRVVVQDEFESDEDMGELAEDNNNSGVIVLRQGAVQMASNMGDEAPSHYIHEMYQNFDLITDNCFMSMVPNPGDGYVRIFVNNSIRLPQLCTIVVRNFSGVTDRSLHFFNQMKALRYLDVTGTKISKTALLNFILLRPEIKVVSSFTDLNKM